jgi:pyrophosphatase PpaX
MKQCRCLLFDLDGTLLDSRDAVIDAVMYTAEHYLPGMFTREQLLARFGESFDDFLASEVAPHTKAFNREEIFGTFFAYVDEHHDRQIRLFPRVKEGLQALRGAGYQLAVVTNKQRTYTVRGLQIAGILNLFDAIVTIDDVRKGKPSAEPLQIAMNKLNVRPDEAVMVGDSKYDLLAAKAAGVKSVLLQWYGTEPTIEAMADCRFADFQTFADELLNAKSLERM